MSSGESGDESSGIESPGPSGSNNHIQLATSGGGTMDSNSLNRQLMQHHQSQHDPDTKGLNNSMNSVIYPAAALANLPQEVLLGLVQAGHLQVHQEEGEFFLYIICILSYS